MIKTLKWFASSFRADGVLTTLAYLKNILYLRYVRDFKKQPFIQKKIHGTNMYLDVNDPGISRTLAIKGTRERDQVYVVQRELQKGMVVLDIGANIGSYALLEASFVGSEGKVYAIEPSPQNFELLNKNVALNGLSDIIETCRVGAADRTGVAQFFVHEASNLHTFHPEKYQQFRTGRNEFRETIDVEVVNICEFIQGKRPIDFIRMDIEGYEVEVMEGMMQGIMEGSLSPKILFESHRPKYDDIHHSMRAQLTKLFDLGYYPKTLISTDESRALFSEKKYTPQRVINTDGVKRGIYDGISKKDAIEFICDIGYVRAVLLERS